MMQGLVNTRCSIFFGVWGQGGERPAKAKLAPERCVSAGVSPRLVFPRRRPFQMQHTRFHALSTFFPLLHPPPRILSAHAFSRTLSGPPLSLWRPGRTGKLFS